MHVFVAPKLQYNTLHPYFFWVPLITYVLARNLTYVYQTQPFDEHPSLNLTLSPTLTRSPSLTPTLTRSTYIYPCNYHLQHIAIHSKENSTNASNHIITTNQYPHTTGDHMQGNSAGRTAHGNRCQVGQLLDGVGKGFRVDQGRSGSDSTVRIRFREVKVDLYVLMVRFLFENTTSLTAKRSLHT